jgi:hypothetical protein
MQKGSKRKSIVIDLTITSEDESSEGDDDIFIDVYNERRLTEFVKENDSSGVEKLLRLDSVKQVKILNKTPLCISTALQFAAHLGRLKILRLLLSAGADDVNVASLGGGTPLLFSVVNNFYETTRLLLNCGAMVDSMVLNSLLSKTLLPFSVRNIRFSLNENGCICRSSREEQKGRGAEVVWLVTRAAALVGARPTFEQSRMMKTKLNRPTLLAEKSIDYYAQEEFFTSKRPAQIWREAAALQRRLIICSERVDCIDFVT